MTKRATNRHPKYRFHKHTARDASPIRPFETMLRGYLVAEMLNDQRKDIFNGMIEYADNLPEEFRPYVYKYVMEEWERVSKIIERMGED